jgi:hypothetical protein
VEKKYKRSKGTQKCSSMTQNYSTYAYEGQEHLSQSLMLNLTNVELEAPSAELQPSSSVFSSAQCFMINVVSCNYSPQPNISNQNYIFFVGIGI